ncbi:SUN domain-containing protein 1-like isoform X5 [Dicentrarchus labrax]|uniref:SUN domain-containing protein 1-like isoform X5 n=1 Tax=Dicentrarchus labrax TaxID=13489 RepID=UPI0021F5CCEF|nr:SUN domain-containing protein 1-like isoform X5 [Dicentrarchus labrax]
MSCDEDVDLQSWGWTDLSSYSSAVSDSEKEQQILAFLHSGTMSRRSLRLDDGLLDRSLPHGSASFSVGGTSWRSTRLLKSRRSQQLSSSCSESLLLNTPRKQSLLNSSLHSVTSDASLLSSLLDDSSVQETTMVDTFWGLDQDMDPKESTIIAEPSTVLADRTLIGSDGRCPKHVVPTPSRVYCKDCESTYFPSSKYTSSSSSVPGPSEPAEPETSTVYCRDRSRKTRTARSSHCGVMNLRESSTNQKELHPNGSLCNAAGDVYRWLNRRLHHMTSNFLPTRFALRLLLVVLPLLLLLLLSLCWFGPAGLQSVLPAVNITEWRTVVSDVPGLSSIYGSTSPQSHSVEGAVEESREVQAFEEPLYSRPPPTETQTGAEVLTPDFTLPSAAVEESTRLGRLEQSLAALWEQVEVGGRREEQRHREVLRLYSDLQQQQQQQQQQQLVSVHSGAGEPWLSGLLDQQLDQLRTRVDEERQQREQTRQQDLSQQQSQTSRLDHLEQQLQALAARTQAVQWRQEAAATASPSSTVPAAVSVGVDRQSHDALLAEVVRLEAALEDVRQDVEGLSGCWDGCRRLDKIQQTISEQVSAQVREEVRTLVYGNQLTVRGGASGDGGGLPDSLLQWLSQQYVSGADLQASLAALELSILQNISLQLEQRGSEEAVREAVLHATGAAGAAVTQEEVHVIVKNALQLFSQDRTGLADYALESGGGSILSTRCSETYETKAALLSLFGVPLWYFSQSPRAVIQPDVHPGNCWAFRGSTGFLVIRLSMKILPTAFSLEHIPKALAPSGTLHSAPQNFSVYGLDDESQDRGKLLGTYTYDEDGEALQTYPVTEESDRAFQIIEVQVLSNWGHPEYTCMYRFRVHGMPADV